MKIEIDPGLDHHTLPRQEGRLLGSQKQQRVRHFPRIEHPAHGQAGFVLSSSGDGVYLPIELSLHERRIDGSRADGVDPFIEQVELPLG